jgi:hypothetical protein
MTTIYEKIILTEPTNVIYTTNEISELFSVSLVTESREDSIPPTVKEYTDNEIILTNTINADCMKRGYWRECVDELLRPIGKIIGKEDVFVEVFYGTDIL